MGDDLGIIEKLFVCWDLETWANVLEVVGFMFALGAFLIGLFIKSEINKLKTNYIFDQRIKRHIKNLESSASELNQLLNEYERSFNAISTQFGLCISELEDLTPKISWVQGGKSRRLIRFLKSRRGKPFIPKRENSSPLIDFVLQYPRRMVQTEYDDVWLVYYQLMEIIRQMENLKLNKDKSI